MTIAIYPGSFDPVTLGHLDVIERASAMFDEVYVVMMQNAQKKYLFSTEERKEMLELACRKFSNVKIEVGEGLTASYAQSKQAQVIVRGLRALMDFEYELQIAHINSHVAPEIETVFLATKAEYAHISSSVVKDLAAHHATLKGLVPDEIIPRLEAKYK